MSTNIPCSDVSSVLYACTVHDAVHSSRSYPGSLWFWCMGSTSGMSTVCLLLKVLPTSINPELMMECELIAHPTWLMHWKKSLGLTTLSCKVGSMRLRPECPWRSRKYKNCSWRISTQLKYFLCPPPAMLLFHFSSDQRWLNTKWSLR